MYRYWGKTKKENDPAELEPYHLVVYHNLDVAASAYAILTENPAILQRLADSCGMDTGHFLLWYVFLMSQHDCGKFSERFQGQNAQLFSQFQGKRDIMPYTLRHDSMGYLLWRDFLLSFLCTGEASPIKSVIDQSLASLEENDDTILDFWSTPVMGHHGKPPTTYSNRDQTHYVKPIHTRQLFSPQAIEDAQRFCAECVQLLNEDLCPSSEFRCSENLPSFLNWDMAGLATLADWLGSDHRSFPYHTEEIPLAEYWKNHAVPQAREAVRCKGILPVQAQGRLSFAELFPHITTPTPLQRWAEDFLFDGSPSLFVVEDVTGSGKTEAAMMLVNRVMSARGARGLFIALPTMATSNQMFERLATSYRRLFAEGTRPSLVLAHGAASVHEQFQQSILPLNTSGDGNYEQAANNDPDESISSECNAWFADARRKAFLADVGVGTVDQVFLGVLHSKFQALRLFGLGSKVLVVDEVHANDTYMHSILRTILTFHAARGGSAILLSATLPAAMRRELAESFRRGLALKEPNVVLPDTETPAPYPLATVYSSCSVIEQPLATRRDVARTVQVRFVNSPNDVPALIIEEARAGRSVCWIRNTVPDAVEAYTTLADNIPADRLHLFHARFALCDRKRIEEEALALFGKHSTCEQRKGRVLIATQVVEQSLDLDFDVLITDLAPVDLVIQRAGRLRRHRRLDDGTLITDDTTPDGRPQPVILYLVSPNPDGEIAANWFSELFPMAKNVYPNHAELWRTARILKDTGCISMPDGARHLIEAVYGDTALDPPAALTDSEFQNEVLIGVEKSIARTNTLKLEDGYTKTWQSWVDDLVTPTRLGDATTTLRLALYRNGNIIPLAGRVAHQWFLSEVRVRTARVNAEATFTGPLAEAVAKEKKTMPDKGKYSVLVPLEEIDGKLRGTAMCNDKIVTIEYSFTTGLSIL